MERMSESKIYDQECLRFKILIGTGIIGILIVAAISLCAGNYESALGAVIGALLHPDENELLYAIIIRSRMPRIIASLLVGAALAVAGGVYQELFANRMASPDLLGVCAGAGCGASTAILLEMSFALISVFSFVGGILAVLLTVALSSIFDRKGDSSISLILSGIVMGGFLNAVLGFTKYLANDTQLSSITFWLLGGFSNVNIKQILIAGPVILIGIGILLLMKWDISLLKHGEASARINGVSPVKVKVISIAVATLVTASAVCLAGTVGWVGLAIPNLMRLIVPSIL